MPIDITSLETLVISELRKVCNWLTANRLTLNIDKSNYVIFRPYQKRLTLKPKIVIYDNVLSKSVHLECKLRLCEIPWGFNKLQFKLEISY